MNVKCKRDIPNSWQKHLKLHWAEEEHSLEALEDDVLLPTRFRRQPTCVSLKASRHKLSHNQATAVWIHSVLSVTAAHRDTSPAARGQQVQKRAVPLCLFVSWWLCAEAIQVSPRRRTCWQVSCSSSCLLPKLGHAPWSFTKPALCQSALRLVYWRSPVRDIFTRRPAEAPQQAVTVCQTKGLWERQLSGLLSIQNRRQDFRLKLETVLMMLHWEIISFGLCRN